MSTKLRAKRQGFSAPQTQPTEKDSKNDDVESMKGDESESEGEEGEWISPTSKSKKAKYVCKGSKKKVCGIAIREKDDSIRCDGCEGWFHPKCQGLTAEAFKALVKFDFIWLCDTCKPSLSSMIQLGKHLEARIEAAEHKILSMLDQSCPKKDLTKQLESKISSMEKTVMGKIREHQEKVTTTLQEQSKVVEAMPKYTSEINQSALDLKTLIMSKEDRDNRETNLLLHNMPESGSSNTEERKEHDAKSFNKVASALLGNQTKIDTVSIYRLGKKAEQINEQDRTEPKPRLMLVKLTSKEDVQTLMKRRMKLREAGFPNIYLTHDLPPEERAKQKKQREKLKEELETKGKENYKIFRGRVVPKTDK